VTAPTEVTTLGITLRQDPVLIDDGVLRIRLTPGVCLYLNDASPEVLRALADAADTAADLKDQAAIVALNTPAPPTVDAAVHTMCVPDWGAAS
jgi:hypothetical protein